MKHPRAAGILGLGLALVIWTLGPVLAQMAGFVPKTPPHPPVASPHPKFGVERHSRSADSTLTLPSLKAVLIVGPIDGDTGPWTTGEKKNMDLAADELEKNNVTVFKFYTPDNDWDRIKAAADGAHFLLYRGHGVYWGKMPTPPVGGFALKDRCISSDEIRRDLSLAPNAIIMLYGCFTAGASSIDGGPLSSQEAQRRVAQYSDPFFDLGAVGYYADWFGDAFQMYVRYLFEGKTLGQAYESYFDFNPETVERYTHPDHPDLVMWLDKDNWDYWQYNNAFAGKPDQTLEDLFQWPPLEVEITAISPNQGARGQTVNVTLTGHSFSNPATLKLKQGLAEVTGENVELNNTETLTATFVLADDQSTGLYDVEVTTRGQTATLPDGFEVFLHGPATQLVLTADENVLPANGTTMLRATLLDAQGNVAVNATDPVTFTLTSGGDSAWLETTAAVTPENGAATNVLTATTTPGTVTIEAAASGLTSDTVTVQVVKGYLELTANPTVLLADGSSESTLTVTVQDGMGNVDTAFDQPITFALTSGSVPGMLVGPNPVTPVSGQATLTLRAGTVPGKVIVTASVAGVNSTTTTVTLNPAPPVYPATKITLWADPVSLTANGADMAQIRALIQDDHDRPVFDYQGQVTFALVSGSASGELLGPPTVAVEGGWATIPLRATTTAGTVRVEATSGNLVKGTVEVPVVACGPATQVDLTTEKNLLPADGTATTILRATLRDAQGNVVVTATDPITFILASGGASGVLRITGAVTPVEGVATNVLTATTTPGTVEIQATANGLESDKMRVEITEVKPGPATRISLTANPASIQANGTDMTTLLASVQDVYGHLVTDFVGHVTFTLTSGSASGELQGPPTVAVAAGQAAITLRATTTAGVAQVEARSGGLAKGTVNVLVTALPGPADFSLTANPTVLLANGRATATLTVTILDASGQRMETATNAVRFIMVEGGASVTLPAQTTVHAEEGIARITLTSTTTPGPATVRVEVENLPPSGGKTMEVLVVGGKITGLVTARDGGTPLVGATVRAFATGTTGGEVAQSVTGNDGTYTLTEIGSGTFELVAMQDGYVPTRRAGVIADASQLTAGPDFILVKQPATSSGVDLVTVPFTFADPTATVVLGERTRAARYNGAGYDFTGLDIAPGGGFWTKPDPDPFHIVAPGTLASQDQAQEIPLSAVGSGWNLVGSAFLQAVGWDLSQIQVREGTEIKSLAEAQEAGWIEDFAWGWNGSAYRLVYDASVVPQVEGRLEPWKGYWVKAKQDCTLLLPPPPGEGSRQSAVGSRQRAKEGSWTVQLVARAEGGSAETVMLGVAPRLAGRSRGEGLQVGFPPLPLTGAAPTRAYLVGNFGQPLAVDLRSGATTRQTWDYIVETSAEVPGSVTLTWPELGRTGSQDVSFTLVDQATGTRRYMRTTSGYTYRPTRGETPRRFQIVVEPGPGNPLQITALQATPTRGPERGAQITFQLNRSAATAVTVLTLTGRVVSQIEQARTRTAGLQQAVWTGQDEEGRPVPPGVYLMEVVATDEEGQQVRAVRAVRMP